MATRRSSRLAAQSLLTSLPTELLTRVLRPLPAPELARARLVLREWRDLINASAAVWSCALPALDPLYDIGGNGMEALWERLGSWPRVAQELSTRQQCVTCSDVCGHCGCDDGPHCAEHCDNDVMLVRNVHQFLRAKGPIIHGKGGLESGEALADAIDAAADFATIRISGRFQMSKGLLLARPIRIVTVGARSGGNAPCRATVDLLGCCVEITAKCIVLEEVIFTTSINYNDIDSDDEEGFVWDDSHVSPAMCVYPGAGLIAVRMHASSSIGTAIVMEDGSAVSLIECTLNSCSEDGHDTMCLGVTAKSYTTLSMYSCIIERTRWGVFAGPEASILAEHNTFRDNEEADISLTQYPQFTDHSVQPWRPSWVRELSEEAAGLGPAP